MAMASKKRTPDESGTSTPIQRRVTRRKWLQASVGATALTGLAGCLGGGGDGGDGGGDGDGDGGDGGGGGTVTGGDSVEGTTIEFQGFGSHKPGMESLAAQFKEKFGVTVNVKPFQDDWQVLARQRAGAQGLDVFQMSMRAVPTAREENLIQPMRIENIPNVDNIEDRFHPDQTPWEPDGGTWTAVPNHFGGNTLAWNTDLWPLDSEPKSWRDLLDPELKGDIGYSQRPNYAVATTYLQFWPDEPREFEANYDERIAKVWDSMENEWKPQVGTWFAGGGEVSQAFANGNVTAGHNFAVIVEQLKADGQPIKNRVAEEGGFMYLDGMAIPKGVEDPKRKAAELFINFSLDPSNRKEYLEAVPTGTTFPVPEKYQSKGYKQSAAVRGQDRLKIFDPVFVGGKADEWTTKIQEIIRA